MDNLELLNKCLDENPEDQILRLAYADALMENGFGADGFIVLAKLGRYPNKTIYYCEWDFTRMGLISQVKFDTLPGLYKEHEFLPDDWLNEMSKLSYPGTNDIARFKTRLKAENTANEAFYNLPIERQKELLNCDTNGIRSGASAN